MTDVSIQLTPESKAALELAIKFFDKRQFLELFDEFFDKEGSKAAGHVAKTMLSGQRLKRRSGNLARSVFGASVRVEGLPALRIGILRTGAEAYAGIQEYGTKGFNPESPYDTIVPKRAKALAMPVNSALTPAGVSRFGGPRKYPGDLRFMPFRKSGVAVGALYDEEQIKALQAAGLKGTDLYLQAEALYILLSKVDIPASYYLRDGFADYLPTFMKNLETFIGVKFGVAS